jgi:Tat protein secretion system quality control protein TatD with DNase activity
MFDAHFHLNFLPRDRLTRLLEEALARGVNGGLVAGVWNDDTDELARWAAAPELISPQLAFVRRGTWFDPTRGRFEVVLAHGLHPEALARRLSAFASPALRRLKLEEAIAGFDARLKAHGELLWAIGETGYDAHPHVLAGGALAGLDKVELLRLQDVAFDACVAAAARAGLPLIVHSRSAWERTLKGIERARAAGVERIMIHCYGGPAQDVARLARNGVSLSFGGVPTWERARKVREAFLACPLEALLLETDAPDLPYEREDGTRPNAHEPAHLSELTQRLAGIRGVSGEELASTSDSNLRRFLSGSDPRSQWEMT